MTHTLDVDHATRYFHLMCGADWRKYKDRINNSYYFPSLDRYEFLVGVLRHVSRGGKLSKTQYDILNSLAQQDKDISHMDMPLKSVMVLQRLELVEHEEDLDKAVRASKPFF